MRIALIDPFAGIAGDMFVGALVAAGAPFRSVKEGLAALDLDGTRVACRKVMRGGVAARDRACGPSPRGGVRGGVR